MNQLTDHQKKALNIKSHIALTANAGSGKTLVLANRYLKIALEQNVSLRNIAAITFTDKAAGELYTKIASEIEKRLSNTIQILEKVKLEEIRQQLVSANISTIHSFCINILREYPVEAKLDSNFIPVDDKTSSELIELSIEEAIKNALHIPGEAADVQYLIRIFASKKNFALQVASLIKHRKNVLTVLKNIYTHDDEEVAKFFYSSFIEYSEKLFIEKIEVILNLIKTLNTAVFEVNNNNAVALSIQNLLNDISTQNKLWDNLLVLVKIRGIICTKSGSIKINGYLGKHLKETLNTEVFKLEEIFSELELIVSIEDHEERERDLAYFGKTILRFFNKTIDIYSNKKRESSYLDYEDILLFTQEILLVDTVRKALSDKFKYILIDEYQDTNEIQYDIFLPLLEDLRKGNLFVVGDEKQSIYMFRDAELEIFNRTKRNIKEIEGESSLLSLPDSFRMAPELCLFTNTLFNNLFSSPNRLFNEVEHSDLVCANDNGTKGNVEILLPKINPDESQNSNQQIYPEAEIVTRKILQIVENSNEQLKINWGDIAVLCRKRKSFVELEKSFIKYGVPFIIVGGKDFYKRQTIYDIFNYFAFLLDESNDAALTGLLRSPFICLSDSQIFEISLQSGKALWSKVMNYLSENPQLYKVLQPLIEIKNNSNKADFVSLLREILNGTNFLTIVASRPDGMQELANIQKIIQLTLNFNLQGYRTLYDYVNFLKESIEQSLEEAQATVTEDNMAVKIMTLHQAKGLEFPVVFLFNSGDSTKADTVKSKSVTINKDFGLLTKLPLKENYFDEYVSAPIIGVNDLISSKKNNAEVRRLFYVGVTRAKYYLIISATPVKNMEFSKDSFMGLLHQGLNIDFNSTNYIIESNLTYLISDQSKFTNITKLLSLNIPIINEIELISQQRPNVTPDFKIKKLSLDIIDDTPSQEIISASKFSVFSQCQLKYNLTYSFGVSEIVEKVLSIKPSMIKRDYEFEVRISEEEDNTKNSTILSKTKGRIIHKLLESETKPSNIEENLDLILNEELKIGNILLNKVTEFRNTIIGTIVKYFDSVSYKHIKSFINYKNEFEIFVEEENNILYGIIDKIIFTKDKIIIVDFKTDNITEKEIGERSQIYINQMNFYSYIVSKLFPNFANIEIRLIFLEHPDLIIQNEITTSDLKETKTQIKEMISVLHTANFVKNTNHCSKCKYSINYSHCIIN